jgi:hypothetical protein
MLVNEYRLEIQFKKVRKVRNITGKLREAFLFSVSKLIAIFLITFAI